MTTHEVIVVDLLQAATSLGARPCRGPLCWYTVRRINGCAFSQVKVEKYAHGQRGSPKTGPLLACEDRNGDMAHSARDLRRDCYAAVDIGASSGRVVVGFV